VSHTAKVERKRRAKKPMDPKKEAESREREKRRSSGGLTVLASFNGNAERGK